MRFLFEAYKNIEPMIELFTPDELSPSEKTLEIIQQNFSALLASLEIGIPTQVKEEIL